MSVLFIKTLYSLLLLLCLHSFYFGLFGYLEKTVQQQKPTIEIYFLFLLDIPPLPPLLTVTEELFGSFPGSTAELVGNVIKNA